MYEYDFVKIETRAGMFRRKPDEDYHEIIEQYAARGWRLVQIFAPPIFGNGLPDFYELIFERKK